MTPTFESEDGGVRLYCGDCMDALPISADVMMTDPPYGVSAKLNSVTRNRLPWSVSGQRKKNDYGSFDDSPEYVSDRVIPAIKEYLKATKRAIITPGNRCLTFYPAPDSFGALYQPASVGLQRWGRCDAQPVFYYGAFPRDSRLIPGTNLSHVLIEHTPPNGHPCPKPVKMWTRLLLVVSLDGEIVVDPFMGSGTTGIACIRTGRRFIGIEIDKHHYATAEARIKRELAQGRLALG